MVGCSLNQYRASIADHPSAARQRCEGLLLRADNGAYGGGVAFDGFVRVVRVEVVGEGFEVHPLGAALFVDGGGADVDELDVF